MHQTASSAADEHPYVDLCIGYVASRGNKQCRLNISMEMHTGALGEMWKEEKTDGTRSVIGCQREIECRRCSLADHCGTTEGLSCGDCIHLNKTLSCSSASCYNIRGSIDRQI
jgi:hypothetical protein